MSDQEELKEKKEVVSDKEFVRVGEESPVDNWWKPEKPGEALLGILESVSANMNGLYWRVRDSAHVLFGTPSNKVLQKKLEHAVSQQEVVIGDTVKITFLGNRVSGDKREYKDYDVEVAVK